MIEDTIARWERYLRGDLPGGLDELLHDDVVFHSPIVFTPQRGKTVTSLYLQAAAASLGGSPAPRTDGGGDADRERKGGFRYTKKVLAGDTAVLEFETSIGATYVNGVDIIRVDDQGRIVEFRVMVRPLQAVNAVHEVMRAALEARS